MADVEVKDGDLLCIEGNKATILFVMKDAAPRGIVGSICINENGQTNFRSGFTQIRDATPLFGTME